MSRSRGATPTKAGGNKNSNPTAFHQMTKCRRAGITRAMNFKRGLLLTFTILALDQLTKYILLYIVGMPHRPPIEVLPFFNLVMVWNPGISFGMLQGVPHGQYLLSALAIVISLFLLNWMRKAEHPLQIIALSLIIGGALGNVVDRILYGAVADFFDFHAFGYHWPAFNIADSTIVIGTALLMIYLLFYEEKTAKRAGHESENT